MGSSITNCLGSDICCSILCLLDSSLVSYTFLCIHMHAYIHAYIHTCIIYADAFLWGRHQEIGMVGIQMVNCSGYYHSAVAEQFIFTTSVLSFQLLRLVRSRSVVHSSHSYWISGLPGTFSVYVNGRSTRGMSGSIHCSSRLG